MKEAMVTWVKVEVEQMEEQKEKGSRQEERQREEEDRGKMERRMKSSNIAWYGLKGHWRPPAAQYGGRGHK